MYFNKNSIVLTFLQNIPFIMWLLNSKLQVKYWLRK